MKEKNNVAKKWRKYVRDRKGEKEREIERERDKEREREGNGNGDEFMNRSKNDIRKLRKDMSGC